MVTKRCPPREGKQSETRTNDLRDRLVSLCKEEEEGRKKKPGQRKGRGKGRGTTWNDESGARALRRGEGKGREGEGGAKLFRNRVV